MSRWRFGDDPVIDLGVFSNYEIPDFSEHTDVHDLRELLVMAEERGIEAETIRSNTIEQLRLLHATLARADLASKRWTAYADVVRERLSELQGNSR